MPSSGRMPHGSLCQEREKLGDDTVLAKAGARQLGVYIDWASKQLHEHGLPPRQARALATDLVATPGSYRCFSSTLPRTSTVAARSSPRSVTSSGFTASIFALTSTVGSDMLDTIDGTSSFNVSGATGGEKRT